MPRPAVGPAADVVWSDAETLHLHAPPRVHCRFIFFLLRLRFLYQSDRPLMLYLLNLTKINSYMYVSWPKKTKRELFFWL